MEQRKFFYEEVQKKYPEFKNITPQIINTLKMEKEKLSLMTFQEFKNDNKDFGNIESVINLSEKISQTIKYDEAVEILKITDRGKVTPLSSLMHKSWSHKLIFEKIKEQVRLIGDNFKLQEFVGTMEYIIIDLKIYKKIKPKRDYMICHGDFDRGNIIFDKEENKMYVIDWSNYKLALRGYDLADYFQDTGLSFKEIKEVYLDQLSSSDQEEIRAKIFFIYQISILWIERLNKDNIEYQISNCIAPAINHMKELVTDKEEIREKRKMK